MSAKEELEQSKLAQGSGEHKTPMGIPPSSDNSTENISVKTLSKEKAVSLSFEELATLADRAQQTATANSFITWFLTILGMGGLALTTKAMWLTFLTTPPGWLLLGASLLGGGIGAYYRYRSEQRKTLAKQRDLANSQLALNNLEYILYKSAFENNLKLDQLWHKIQQIDEPADRARLQCKLLTLVKDTPTIDEKAELSEPNLSEAISSEATEIIKKQQLTATQELSSLSSFDQNIKTYQALQHGTLTPDDKASLQRSATGAFFTWSTLIFGLGSLTLLKLAVGILAFSAIGAALASPAGIGFLVGAVVIGGIAAYLTYNGSRKKAKLEAHSKEVAEKDLAFNASEFERLKSKIELNNDKFFTQSNKIAEEITPILDKAWNKISQSNLTASAKAQIQADFLQDLTKVTNNPPLLTAFNKKWLVAIENKFEDSFKEIEEAQNSKDKSPTSRFFQNSIKNPITRSLTSFINWTANTISVSTFTANNISTAKAYLKVPANLITVFGIGAVAGIGNYLFKKISTSIAIDNKNNADLKKSNVNKFLLKKAKSARKYAGDFLEMGILALSSTGNSIINFVTKSSSATARAANSFRNPVLLGIAAGSMIVGAISTYFKFNEDKYAKEMDKLSKKTDAAVKKMQEKKSENLKTSNSTAQIFQELDKNKCYEKKPLSLTEKETAKDQLTPTQKDTDLLVTNITSSHTANPPAAHTPQTTQFTEEPIETSSITFAPR